MANQRSYVFRPEEFKQEVKLHDLYIFDNEISRRLARGEMEKWVTRGWGGGGGMKEGGYEVMRRKRRRGKQVEERAEGI